MTDLPVTEKFISEIDAHQKIIYKVCHLYTSNQADFNDLYQDIVLQLWKSYPNFKGNSKLGTWIYRVSLNTALYKLRQQKVKMLTDTVSQINYDLPDMPESDPKDYIEKVKELFVVLTDIEKAFMTLYLDEYSYEEISLIMGISKTNVSTKINRIKQKLKITFNNKIY